MLIIKPKTTLFNEETQSFITIESTKIRFEHSLLAISKWESFFEKPFINSREKSKTSEEILFYIKCMCLDDVDDSVFDNFSEEDFLQINSYMESSQTATSFFDSPNNKKSNTVITSELIYYWMISFHIPLECENWHLNRLLSLIRICSLKNATKDKKNQKDLAAHHRQINEQRRAAWGTSG